MTNQQVAPGALRPIARYKIGYRSDEWGMRSSTPGGVSDPAGQWVRYDDHIAALASAAAPAPQPNTAYAALPDTYYLAGGEVKTWDENHMRAFADATCALRIQQPSTTPQADSQPAPSTDQVEEILRERDDAEDFIDVLLDEVLGHERPEWSSAYGRADALNDVQERMTALHKPAVDKAWGRFQSAMAAPQQEAQEPCPTCIALARTVMLDQVSFDRKPDCYGIRQITDDEGVEEWEDIRTSPDVAREEANDMMATGRGEIYEVVPLWTTPQHPPAAQAGAVPLTKEQRNRIVLTADTVSEAIDMVERHHGIKGGQHGAE